MGKITSCNGSSAMKVRKVIRFTVICLLCIWVGIIFSFSLQAGKSSHAQSGKIKNQIQIILREHHIGINRSIYVIYQPFMADGEKVSGEDFIRKSAHVAEYFALGVFCFALFKYSVIFNKDKMRRLKWSLLLIGPLVALVDEKIIQKFLVIHRTSSIKDVLLDSLAFLIAFILLWFVTLFISVRNGKPNKPLCLK